MSAPRVLRVLVTVLPVIFSSCGPSVEIIDVPAGSSVTDVLATNIYAPFDRETLLGGHSKAEEAYGEPDDYRADKERDADYREYIAKHGRIRICEALVESREYETAHLLRHLEFYPGKLYLADFIRPEYLPKVPDDTADSTWRFSVLPSDEAWVLTVEVDGRAVVKVIDSPRHW